MLLSQVLDTPLVRQLLALALTIIAALVVGLIVRRFYRVTIARLAVARRVGDRVNQVRRAFLLDPLPAEIIMPRVRGLLVSFGALWVPLIGWLAGQVALGVFRARAWPVDLLARLVPIWLLLLGFRLALRLAATSLSPAGARRASRALQLLVLLAVLLQLSGTLDRLLGWLARPVIPLADGISVVSILGALLVLALFLWLSGVARRAAVRTAQGGFSVSPSLSHTIASFVGYAVTALGLMLAVATLGIELTTLTVLVGALAVGVGFGLQEVISNFVSGLILLTERSIKPGDVLEVNGELVVLERLNMRSSIVRNNDNVEMIVPNESLLTNTVRNYSLSTPLVRVRVPVGVAYSSNPYEVREALLAAARAHPRTVPEPPPTVHFMDYGESSLDFALLAWIDGPATVPAYSSDLRFLIWDELTRRQIELPFPQRDLHVRSGVPWDALLARLGPDKYQESDGAA